MTTEISVMYGSEKVNLWLVLQILIRTKVILSFHQMTLIEPQLTLVGHKFAPTHNRSNYTITTEKFSENIDFLNN